MTMTASAQHGLDVLRRGTKAFIDDDPTTVTLIAHAGKVKMPGGGYDAGTGTPRVAQTFKLVANFNGDGIQTAVSGVEDHRWTYTLIGMHNAVIEIGDTWNDGDTTYRVVSLLQNNGYEKRAAVVAQGKDPNYG